MLVIFSGGSGVGKNTVIKALVKKGDFLLMPTYSTREKRPHESDGNPYYFLTDDEFKQKIAENELYEYQNVHGHYYGTSKKLLKEAVASGKILAKDIDVLGTQNLLKTIGDDVKILTLFLKVDSVEVLKRRLIGRKEKDIDKRLSRYEMEMSYSDKYDYIITNDSLSKTTNLVRKIVAAEKVNAELSVAMPFTYDEKKIGEYVKKLNDGETLSPIKIAYVHHAFYIVDGAEKYLAGIISGKHVAKEIVKAKIVKCENGEWETALNKVKNNNK